MYGLSRQVVSHDSGLSSQVSLYQLHVYCPIPQATVYLLEKLDVILAKASEEDIRYDVLPMIFSTLESNSIQGQVSCLWNTARSQSKTFVQTLRYVSNYWRSPAE